MKVDLEKLIVGITGITETPVVGILNKNKTIWLHKTDASDSFYASVIQKFLGKIDTVSYSDGSVFEISVKQIKGIKPKTIRKVK